MQFLLKTQAAIPKDKKAIAIPSPISGTSSPLSEVPDFLFSQGLYGDGIAIKLAGNKLLAPFKSKITQLPATKNYVQLTAANGLQLFVQLGLESEKLMGEGFRSSLAVNDTVERFQPVIEFDLLTLRRKLPSLLSPVTFCNCEKLTAIQPHYGKVTAAESAAMTIYL